MNSIDSAAERLAAILTRDIPKMTSAKPIPPPRHPAKRQISIVGVSTPEELAEAARISREKKDHKARIRRPQVAHNKKPQIEITCPCGKIMLLSPSEAAHRKYCDQTCRKLFFKGTTYAAKYVITPEIEAEIRDAYLNRVRTTKEPVLRNLAEKLNIPQWKIRLEAVRRGIAPPGIKSRGPEWSEKEEEIVRNSAHLVAKSIRCRLKAAGFIRSDNAINLWIGRHMGPKPKAHYSAEGLGRFFGTSNHVVARWIRMGWLKGVRRGTERNHDEWDIRPEDVKTFIVEHVEILDFRKLDKFWLVELLTSQEPCVQIRPNKEATDGSI